MSDDELKAELERREKREEEKKSAPPEPLREPNFEPLRKMIIRGTLDAIDIGAEDDDFQHYLYEAAMEAVYGKGFWVWRNKQKW